MGRDGLEAPTNGRQPLSERGVVSGEQQEQAVPDRVERLRSSLPNAQDVGIEDDPAHVVELEISFEPGRRRQVVRVQRLDLGEMLALRRQLAEQGFAPSVAQQIVVLVEANRGPEDRVVADQPDEANLDELVESIV